MSKQKHKPSNDASVQEIKTDRFHINETLKSDAISLSLLFIAGIIIFKLAFYSESIYVIFRAFISFYWIFAIPGFAVLYFWKQEISFAERFLIGTALGIAIIGIGSYYLGLVGINIKYSSIILPSVSIIAGAFALIKSPQRFK